VKAMVGYSVKNVRTRALTLLRMLWFREVEEGFVAKKLLFFRVLRPIITVVTTRKNVPSFSTLIAFRPKQLRLFALLFRRGAQRTFLFPADHSARRFFFPNPVRFFLHVFSGLNCLFNIAGATLFFCTYVCLCTFYYFVLWRLCLSSFLLSLAATFFYDLLFTMVLSLLLYSRLLFHVYTYTCTY
jgi:hypothetical protein